MLRTTTVTAAAIACAAALTLSGCGGEDDVAVEASEEASATVTPEDTETTEPAVEVPGEEASPEASATVDSAQDETTATTNAAAGNLATGDVSALGGLVAFEQQAQEMVALTQDRDLTPEFAELTTMVARQAEVLMTDIQSIAASQDATVTAGNPAGLLTDQQVQAAGTPSGPEFEMAWKTQMKKQREAAVAFLKANPGTSPEVQSMITSAVYDLEMQAEDM